MGAWIEIVIKELQKLKTIVAPYMGAWIEMDIGYRMNG